jgi:hypothetical protein
MLVKAAEGLVKGDYLKNTLQQATLVLAKITHLQ